jgi:hypothetical protein
MRSWPLAHISRRFSGLRAKGRRTLSSSTSIALSQSHTVHGVRSMARVMVGMFFLCAHRQSDIRMNALCAIRAERRTMSRCDKQTDVVQASKQR